ncbi:MAG: hypothetical protein GDA44_02440 [Prochloron sp. SP5CPC1]|nr:hypothetical protein [Candidatus Paraprochloron terpiosi SP5CPC1]
MSDKGKYPIERKVVLPLPLANPRLLIFYFYNVKALTIILTQQKSCAIDYDKTQSKYTSI